MDLDKGIQDNVIRALAEFIAAPRFQRHFEQFFLDHALTFTDEPEHRLDYMEIYLRFQDMFNEQMEAFLASANISEDEFAQRCQKVIKSDPKAEQYLEIVIASMDYDAFFGLMKAMRSRASLDRSHADAKGTHIDDDDDADLDEAAKDASARVHGSAKALSTKRLRDDDDVRSESKRDDDTGDLEVARLELRDDKLLDSNEAKSARASARELK